MSLYLIEGFDDGLVLDRWNNTTGLVAANIDAAYGRHGKGIHLGDTPVNWLRMSVDSLTEICVGFAFNVNDIGGTVGNLVDLQSSVNYYLYLNDSDNSIGVNHQNGGSSRQSDPNVFSLNTWHYLEFHTVCDNTVGSYDIRIDGSTIISATGLDTVYSSYYISHVSIAESVDSVWVDDLYILDGTSLTPLGDIEVVTLLPTADGNSSAMLGSDSNYVDNWALVDNNAAIPPATTEYVGSATEGVKDTYAMGDLTGTPTVLGVQSTLYAAMTDTGPKSMRPVVRSGTTDYTGTTVPLMNSVYKPIDEMWETDPDTAVAWTYGGVNAAEVGQEVRDS